MTAWLIAGRDDEAEPVERLTEVESARADADASRVVAEARAAEFVWQRRPFWPRWCRCEARRISPAAMFSVRRPNHFERAEPKNGGPSPVRLVGDGLIDEDANWHRIAATLPNVPVEALVVRVFDGQGAPVTDRDFGENVATLRSRPG